jgi:hypothetical protein
MYVQSVLAIEERKDGLAVRRLGVLVCSTYLVLRVAH